LVGAAALISASCEHYKDTTPRGETALETDLTVTEDGSGGYKFAYSGQFFDEKGNFDFSRTGAAGKVVRLTFNLSDASVAGLKFKSEARDAMWIVDKKNVDPATGSPRGPYQGRQFHSFAVSDDGLSLSVTDENNDGVLYRYGLRFDLGGATVIDDPDGQNAGGGGHN
jgi:hypothetical protein